MRMFLYYAAHSFKNQVKKLFKTWVLVFMLACCLIGVIVGVGVGMVLFLLGTLALFVASALL